MRYLFIRIHGRRSGIETPVVPMGFVITAPMIGLAGEAASPPDIDLGRDRIGGPNGTMGMGSISIPTVDTRTDGTSPSSNCTNRRPVRVNALT